MLALLYFWQDFIPLRAGAGITSSQCASGTVGSQMHPHCKYIYFFILGLTISVIGNVDQQVFCIEYENISM